MCIGDAAFKSWTQGNLTRVEQLLTYDISRPFDPFWHSRALAQRALVRTRLKQWEMAIDDAKKVISRCLSSSITLKPHHSLLMFSDRSLAWFQTQSLILAVGSMELR